MHSLKFNVKVVFLYLIWEVNFLSKNWSDFGNPNIYFRPFSKFTYWT
jgi:hypothetical protein